jgi:Na+/proline symporter
MSEFIAIIILIVFTAVVGVFSSTALETKPSLEKSKRIFWQSLMVVPFGLILSGAWYLMSMDDSVNTTGFQYLSIFALADSIGAFFFGLRHLRKYREYTRMMLEINTGLSATESGD